MAVDMKFQNLGIKDPLGYTKITGHWVFDINLDFTSKAQFVIGDQIIYPPHKIIYLNVV